MSRRIILAVHSDTHAGCRFGLMNPDVTLYQEGPKGELIAFVPTQTATQEYEWNLFCENQKEIFEVANGDELHVVHNGDECHGNKYPVELVTTRMADQIAIAVANMKSWGKYKNTKTIRMGASTAAHNFGEGSSTILVADQLRGILPDVDISVFTHARARYNDVLVDYSHKGPPPGSRDWLRGNIARFYLRDLMYQDILADEKPADLIFRAHFHSPVYEQLEIGKYHSSLFVTPSYCTLGEHGVDATRSAPFVTNGMIYFEIIDGKVVSWKRLYKQLDIRTEETL